jgi:uncharacterized protein (TIGR02569 family)
LNPTFAILQAFNLTGDPSPLPGGQNNSFKVDHFVLKHVGSGSHHEWVASILSKVNPQGFRVSTPVISRNNNFVFDGWTCSSFQPGIILKGHEKEKLDVSRLFHKSLTALDLNRYQAANDRWQVAHRIAWETESCPPGMNSDLVEYIESLLRYVQSTPNYPIQLVHGDLAGNVLFHDGLPPVIIDFSPTLAPVEYAEAILIADAIAWHDAPLNTVELLPQNDLYKDMLLRAVIFRLAVAAQLPEGGDSGFIKTLDAFGELINRLIG